MGLFNLGKKTDAPVASMERTGTEVEFTGGLNLQKNNILDLRKYSDTLSNVRVAAGWDFLRGVSYDLDLCAFLLDERGRAVKKVYYGSKSEQGIALDGDNLTGEGDGDDENIRVKLNEIPANISSIVFAVVIYSASGRGQKFAGVQNAFVRLVDEGSNGREICRYSLSNDGGNNTAVTFAELYRNDNGWSFRAIGDYSVDTIDSLYSKYR